MVTESGELTPDESRELEASLAHWNSMSQLENDSNFRGLAATLGAPQRAIEKRRRATSRI